MSTSTLDIKLRTGLIPIMRGDSVVDWRDRITGQSFIFNVIEVNMLADLGCYYFGQSLEAAERGDRFAWLFWHTMLAGTRDRLGEIVAGK